jgi:hypothetical protein
MPAKATRKSNPLNLRISTNVDLKLRKAFLDRAAGAGMSDARYLRYLIEADAGLASPTKSIKRRTEGRVAQDNLAHEVHQVGLHIRKVGTNVNQLSKQANTGMVPITRAEAVQMMQQLQLAMGRALSVLERVLA